MAEDDDEDEQTAPHRNPHDVGSCSSALAEGVPQR